MSRRSFLLAVGVASLAAALVAAGMLVERSRPAQPLDVSLVPSGSFVHMTSGFLNLAPVRATSALARAGKAGPACPLDAAYYRALHRAGLVPMTVHVPAHPVLRLDGSHLP